MPAGLARLRKPQRIFRRKFPGARKVRQNPKTSPGRSLGDPPVAIVEQRGVTAEFVDDEAADYRGVLGVDDRLDPDHLVDYAAPLDIADYDVCDVGPARKVHVIDVVRPPMSFCR